MLLTPHDIANYVSSTVPKQRIESFFCLGLSISKIVTLKDGLPAVRAFSQLMEEWEYVHSGSTMQSVKFVMAKNSNCIYPQTSPIDGYSDLARPSVYKFHSTIVYEHLQLPHIPFELDYVEVFYSLCVELSKLYDKLISDECFGNQVVYDAIVRLDTRVKHHIINLVSKEITEISAVKVKAGTRGLRSLAGIFFPNNSHNQSAHGFQLAHNSSSASLNGHNNGTGTGTGNVTATGSANSTRHASPSSSSVTTSNNATVSAATTTAAAGRATAGNNSVPTSSSIGTPIKLSKRPTSPINTFAATASSATLTPPAIACFHCHLFHISVFVCSSVFILP